MSEQHKALVRRLFAEVWNEGDLAVVDELIDEEYVGHPSEVLGTEGYKQFVAELRRAFPDIRFVVEDEIAEGDRVVARWKAHGTHRGEYFGMPPTGKPAVISGVELLRFADDKAVECWGEVDQLGLLQQLGVIPAS